MKTADTAADIAPASAAQPVTDPRADRIARIKLILLFLMFASPVIASYVTYYVIQPQGRTNYGELIQPQRPVLALPWTSIRPGDNAQSGAARGEGAAQFKGKWLMVTGLRGANRQSLERRLYLMRQVRLTTGKDMDRIERGLVVLDDELPAAALLEQHPGLLLLRLAPEQWRASFSSGDDRIYLVDPLGNLMLQFPLDPDPNKMKKDIAKLLRASRVG